MQKDPRDSQFFDQFEVSLETWKDERFLSKTELRAVAMFTKYLVNLSEAQGWRYDGHSFRVAAPMSCLVVKATLDGIPYVVFTSGRTTSACIVGFIRKLEEGWLEWRPDRYRQ